MKLARLISAGMGVSLQDRGRPGWARFGVPPGGAMDGQAMGQANHLVGNPPHLPVLEILMQGAEVEFLVTTWVAVTGGGADSGIQSGTARPLTSGTRLRFRQTRASPRGVWTYLAVPGGWESERWFGSVSTHVRAALGNPPRSGVILHANAPRTPPFSTAVAARAIPPTQPQSAAENFLSLRLYPGVQFHEFSSEDRALLEEAVWTVSPESDRTGYRLEGPPLLSGPQITSEPLTPGTVQIPGNGKPIVIMPDGPTVGGYPKLGWMPPEARWKLAQSPPGSRIHFQLTN